MEHEEVYKIIIFPLCNTQSVFVKPDIIFLRAL